MSTFSGNPVTANLATLRRSSPNSSSQYSQWRIQKDLGGRCSWKFVAIFFVLVKTLSNFFFLFVADQRAK
jgi:hypothetical protein